MIEESMFWLVLFLFIIVCVVEVMGVNAIKKKYLQKEESLKDARKVLCCEMRRASECSLEDAGAILKEAGIFVAIDESCGDRVVAHLPKYFWTTSGGVLTAKTIITAYKYFLRSHPNSAKAIELSVRSFNQLLLEQVEKDPANTLPVILGLSQGCVDLDVHIRKILT